MAQIPRYRSLQVLRTRFADFQHVILRDPMTRPVSTARGPFLPRFFQSASRASREAFPRHRKLAKSFHPPRKSQTQQARLQSDKANNGKPPSPDPISQLDSPEGRASQSLSERLRKLSREYGWTALGVYLALSALDFPFCFLAVRMLGTERIARGEHVIMRGFWTVVSMPFPGGEEQVRGVFRGVGDSVHGVLESVGLRQHEEHHIESGESPSRTIKEAEQEPDGAVLEQEWTWGVEEAEAAHRDNASLATQLALAYAIHKSFIFLRVPLTAAVLPRVVKTLRGWGYNIGKRTPKTPS